MPDTNRASRRLDPALAWTVVTDAPLQGLALAREAGRVLAWDEGRTLYWLDLDGQRLADVRTPGRIVAAAISDDATLAAVLVEGSRLLLLDGAGALREERAAPADAANVTVDPHGRYLAVGTKTDTTYLFNRSGKAAGRFQTRQPLAFLRFIPARPLLIGAAAQGLLVAVELGPGSGPGKLEAETAWSERTLSKVGRLAVGGDGGMILLSCFNHGVQRYDLNGQNEGAYHLGGTATHAVPDFAGRSIGVATLEGEVAILNAAGNVRWRTGLPRPALSLECDALGRFLIYGLATGEICRLDLEGGSPGRPVAPSTTSASAGRGGVGPVRAPDWTIPLARSEDEAETAVLTVLDDPPRIGAILRNNRLAVFTTGAKALGQAPEIAGGGRILRTAPGWIGAATDKMILLYDARRNGAHRLDLSLFGVTHLAIRPDDYGAFIVQERDRIGRASLAGRWLWKHELRAPIEEVALGPGGLAAFTGDDGSLRVLDPAGGAVGGYEAEPAEPLLLVEAPPGAPDGVAWLTLARRSQRLRGHLADGRAVWETPTPFEGWQLHRVGSAIVVAAPDGRALAYDGAGYLRARGEAGDARSVFIPGPDGTALRLARSEIHLICTHLDGSVLWRSVVEGRLGPVAAGPMGVAALIGRDLAWFATSRAADDFPEAGMPLATPGFAE